jgi:hypothetical protein
VPLTLGDRVGVIFNRHVHRPIIKRFLAGTVKKLSR